MPDPTLYREHLRTLETFLDDALEASRRDGVDVDAVVFHAGRADTYHADDRVVPFESTPHFRRYAPIEGPDHVALARPGEPVRVVVVRPADYWYDTSPPPPSYWEEAVRHDTVGSFDDVADLLGAGALERAAFVGGCAAAAERLGIEPARREPSALMARLDWHRAYKTPYEIAHLRAAAETTAAGHHAARAAFERGGSERDILRAYLEGCDAFDGGLPYDAIVALDDKAAILHYQNRRPAGATAGNTLLIDAGTRSAGYAIDITRTWIRDDVPAEFAALVHGVDVAERRLVDLVTPGRDYAEIHITAHRAVASLLSEVGIVRVDAESAYDRGLTHPFLPHGVGHHLGLQVHDVGGRQAGPDGGEVAPPEGHPFLRTTRRLDAGHVVTIEPGLYFIPMLLDPLREGPEADAVDWGLVDRLTPYGGVRIEDDIVCREGDPEDLTRPLVEGPRGA